MSVGIIGSGPAAIFAALKLINNGITDITIIEAGKRVEERENKLFNSPKHGCCGKCNYCAVNSGQGGAGTFSDGKLNFSSFYGGWMNKKMNEKTFNEYVSYIMNYFKYYIPNDNYFQGVSSFNYKFKDECNKYGMKFLHSEKAHLGTDNNVKFIYDIFDLFINKKIKIFYNRRVNGIGEYKNQWFINAIDLKLNKECPPIFFDNLIIAAGRSGTKWVKGIAEKLDIDYTLNPVDIGVRVETKNKIVKEVSDQVYEPKIYCKSSYSEDVRLFCFNYGGSVTTEKTNGVISANGYAFSNHDTNNSNFALLNSIKFTKPFTDTVDYATSIAKMTNNMAGGDKLLLQRFGDFIRNRRTHNIENNSVIPTINPDYYACGDVSRALPYNVIIGIKEAMLKLDKIMPGIAGDDTLLYASEIKFYSNRFNLDENMQTHHKNLYICGDCSGWTRSIIQAAISGVIAAENIIKENK